MVLRKPHYQKKYIQYDMLSSLLRKSFHGFNSHVMHLVKNCMKQKIRKLRYNKNNFNFLFLASIIVAQDIWHSQHAPEYPFTTGDWTVPILPLIWIFTRISASVWRSVPTLLGTSPNSIHKSSSVCERAYDISTLFQFFPTDIAFFLI